MELHTHVPEAGEAQASSGDLRPKRVWYSPRGAKRGIFLAALAAALWLAWAAGYLQGIGDISQPVRYPVVHSTLV